MQHASPTNAVSLQSTYRDQIFYDLACIMHHISHRENSLFYFAFTINFDSVNDGDTLIIQDTISNISYDSNTTTVTFEWAEGNTTGSLVLSFEGDITDSYQAGDGVKITLKIKRVKFTYEIQEAAIYYDMLRSL